MEDEKTLIQRDRGTKYGRLSGLQEAKAFADRNNLKTENMLSNKHKNALYRKNVLRNKLSGMVTEPEDRKFKLSQVTGIKPTSDVVKAPFLPSSRIQAPPQSFQNRALTKVSEAYNKILDKVDPMKDKLVGGAVGFTNQGVIPGFTTDTTSGISRFDVKGDPFKATNRFMKGDLDDLKEAYKNEAAKSVRVRGDNIDPFNKTSSARNLGRVRQLQNRINGGLQADLLRESNSVRTQVNSVDKALQVTGGENDVKSLLSQKESLLKQESNITRKLDRNIRILSTRNTKDFSNAKRFLPKEGVNGYGLGVNNYLNASRKELFVRGVGFTGGIVGASGAETLMNSFGIVTAKQRAVTQSKGLLGKMFSAGMQSPLMTYGSLLLTASSGGDLSDFVETQLTFAGGLQGWRIGSSFGGMMFKGTNANLAQVGGKNMISAIRAQGASTVLRGAAGVVGGATGFALGAAVVAGASWLAQDITSNRSTIKKIAKDFTTKTATMNTQNTRQSLTMRQMSINKLAKSGLNDRATLLGNESRVLKGIM